MNSEIITHQGCITASLNNVCPVADTGARGLLEQIPPGDELIDGWELHMGRVP